MQNEIIIRPVIENKTTKQKVVSVGKLQVQKGDLVIIQKLNKELLTSPQSSVSNPDLLKSNEQV